MAQKPITRDAIKRILRDFGPMTMAEIAAEIHKPIGTINSCINTARKTKAKHFYIFNYDRRIGMKGGFPAIFAEGNRKDAPYPDTSRRTKDHRYYEQNKERLKFLRRGVTPGHFDMLIAQVTR